jgi:hypothetical protein
MWITIQPEKDRAIFDEIHRMDDRAAAIISCGYLERSLEAAVRSKLKDDKKILNKFLRGMGPLATLSAKIDMAFLLDLYDDDYLKCLHSVREIRNLFSHDPNPLHFSAPEIVKCSEGLFDPSQKAWDFHHRLEKMSKSAPDVIAKLAPFLVSHLRADDSVRAKYLGSIQLCVFLLTVQSLKIPVDIAFLPHAPPGRKTS